MMTLITQFLTFYIWGIACILLFFLFGIAQFFEQRLSEKNVSHKRRRHYPLFLVTMGLFAVGAIIYIVNDSTSTITGNFYGDGVRIIGSFVFAYAGYALLNTMLGGQP